MSNKSLPFQPNSTSDSGIWDGASVYATVFQFSKHYYMWMSFIWYGGISEASVYATVFQFPKHYYMWMSFVWYGAISEGKGIRRPIRNDVFLKAWRLAENLKSVISFLPVLWIQLWIQIGSAFSNFVNPGP